MIRFYERVLKNEYGINCENLLDFGCGNGIHSTYFETKGFTVYGVDTSELAINTIKENTNTHNSDNYYLISPGSNLLELFKPNMFDVIFANQSLYYLDTISLKNCIDQLYCITKSGGICFFTMMSSNNCYYSNILESTDTGLCKVSLCHRLHETTYINFTHSTKELIERFRPYHKIHIGRHCPYEYICVDDEDGCSKHYMFIVLKSE